MAKVRATNSTPELAVRSELHALGYRFRLHRRELPGTPDIVFVGRRKVIFVHGCFWHQHPGCRKATIPKTRTDFWKSKLDANVVRDQRNLLDLQAAGWSVLIVWECHVIEVAELRRSLELFLNG